MCGITLVNVLFVLEFTHNLLSVTKLCKDKNCEVTFKEKKCTIISSKSRATFGVGYLNNNLYYLSDVTKPDIEKRSSC